MRATYQPPDEAAVQRAVQQRHPASDVRAAGRPRRGVGLRPGMGLRRPLLAFRDRAARGGGGALPLLFPPRHYRIAAGQIAEGAAAAGRDPASIDVAACIWCSIDGDPGRAREALAAKIAYYGPSFSADLLSRSGLRPA